jgi:hypothetical protein
MFETRPIRLIGPRFVLLDLRRPVAQIGSKSYAYKTLLENVIKIKKYVITRTIKCIVGLFDLLSDVPLKY